MHLYQEAYGFTRLRLLVDVFEGWLGVLVLATLAAGVTLRAAWLPRFGLFGGVALLLSLAALNPDAWIAERNLDRYAATGTVDWSYLADLSDDDWLEWNLGHVQARAFTETHADDWPYRPACPGQTVR